MLEMKSISRDKYQELMKVCRGINISDRRIQNMEEIGMFFNSQDKQIYYFWHDPHGGEDANVRYTTTRGIMIDREILKSKSR